jgi:DNA-binding NtrC family response regulator
VSDVTLITPVRLLLIGAPGSEFRLAAEMARSAGAEVIMADTVDAALDAVRTCGADIVLIDVTSDVAGFIAHLRRERIALPVLACGIDTSAAHAVAAIHAGARDYVPLPPDCEMIAAVIVSVARNATRHVGADSALARATDLALGMAHAGAAILISGEPGCGKETLARIVHDASGRRGRFLAVDCLDSTPEVIESELFGHEVGAFAGACARRVGRIEEAAGGTVFLREVGALPPAMQARLLGMIEDQVLRRIGGDAPIALAARIIASSSVDLDALVAQGRFRGHLLARLGLMRITVPPLARRGDDIALLARHFATQFAHAEGLALRPFTAAALAQIATYPWPGNVRELEDVVHRAVLLARDSEIPESALMLADGSRLVPAAGAGTPAARLEPFFGSTVEEVERELILETLKRCRGNRTSASTILGISVRTMRNKLKAFIEAGIAVSPAS